MAKDKELREIQDPNTWDWERAERRPGGDSKRVVVSVAFSREQFEAVAERAREQGMKTSDFIRAAALGSTEPRRTRDAMPAPAVSSSHARRAKSS